MLGRTANGLYWMFRYIERAENIARLIDAGLRMSLTHSAGEQGDWDSVLQSAGMRTTYDETHEEITGPETVDFMLRGKSNPSSVLGCIESARNNGRMVRTALTRECWEAMNEFWIDMKQVLGRKVRQQDLPGVIDGIKRRAGLVRGAFHGTTLRNEGYNFSRMGTFIERADNTARILDVKYYVLLPSVSYVGSSLDNTQWESILRSVSAYRAFGWAYDAEISAANIADFLILNSQLPRSLHYCYEKICSNLGYLGRQYGQTTAAHETAANTLKSLQRGSIEEIMDTGLHEFIEEFIRQNNQLGIDISESYRFY